MGPPANAWENVAAIQTDTLGWDNIRIAETLDSLAVCRYQLNAFDQAARKHCLRQGCSQVEIVEGTDDGGNRETEGRKK
jgi:hypothetical protein